MYCGKPVEMTNDSLGKQVVKSLLVKVPEVPKKHIVYFNKLFTTLNFILQLLIIHR